MVTQSENSQTHINQALKVLNSGGVIAYPTEFCFGLGCDPRDYDAVRRILNIKQRSESQGLILAAANENQVSEYAQLQSLDRYAEISKSWPGAVTWVLPRLATTPAWISGNHGSVAVRVIDHSLIRSLCENFGGAIVSTSANIHGEEACTTTESVRQVLGHQIDYIIDGSISHFNSKQSASTLMDALTGERLR